MLTVLEKVILLQGVDVFAEVPGDHLATLAAVAEELNLLEGDVLYAEGEAADALYLVLDGGIRLVQGERELSLADQGRAFGTWALFDEEPRLTSAVAAVDSTLLAIDREDFADLLADHVQITRSILKRMVRRLRGLMSRAGM